MSTKEIDFDLLPDDEFESTSVDFDSLPDDEFDNLPEFEAEETPELFEDSSSSSYWGIPKLRAPEDELSVSAGEALARGAAQGVTLGFGEELSAGAGALLPTATDVELDRDLLERYQAIRDQLRKENIEAQEQRPGTYLAGEVLGGAALTAPVGAAGAVAKTASLLSKAKAGKTLTSLGKYAIPAAIEGGIYGAGISEAELTKPNLEEVSEFAKDIGSAAALGAVAGPAIPAATKAAKKGLDIGKAGIKKVQKFGEGLAEDRPFFGAFRAGLRGQAIYSRPKVEQLLKEPTEKLAYELAKEVSDLGERVAKPAEQKIEDAYRKTLEEAGKNLRLKGEEFSTFIRNKLNEHGKVIEKTLKEAEEAGTTVDISDILKTTKKNIEDLVLTDQVSQARAKELTNLFNKNLYDEIKTERKLTEMFRLTPEEELTPILSREEIIGKEMTPDQLKEAGKYIGKRSEIISKPKIAKEIVTELPEEKQLEKAITEELITREPIKEIPIKIARAIKNTLGDVSSPRQQQLEGELRVVAGQAYSEIKKSLDDIFANRSDYMAANQGYSAVKDLLEMAGEKRIDIDRLSGEVLTPERFAKIFEKIGSSLKEGDTYTYGRLMDKLKRISPEAGEKFDLGIRQASEQYAEVYGQRGLSPLEKGRTLLSESTPEVQKAVDEITNIEQLKKQVGELDPIKRQVTETGEYVEMPESKVRNFIARLGQNYFDGTLGAAEDVKATINILGKYNPKLAEKLKTEGAELAELSRLGRITSKTDAITGEATFSPRGVVFGSLSQILVAGSNIAGLKARKIGINKIAKTIAESPDLLGKFYEPLLSASRAGAVPFALTANILSKEDPEFREVADNIGEKYGYSDSETDADRLKNYLDFVPAEAVPAEYNQFIIPLKNSLKRGDSSFKSTIFIMSQQYPKFREFLEELKNLE